MGKKNAKERLDALVKHLNLSGYKASYNSYFKAVQVFVVDFAAASTVEMLKAEGYEAWSALTGRVIGYSPQAVVYAK